MQAGKPRHAVKKGRDRGAGIEAVLGQTPCLQCATRHVKHPGRLALRDPLGVQLALACKQVSAFEARPALVAIMIATVLFLAYRCHRLPPLLKTLPGEKWKAKDGEVAA
jgi:hypothetical protein